MASNHIPKTKGGINNDNFAEIIREWDLRSQNNQNEENLAQKKIERVQQIHSQEKIIFNQKQQETQNKIKIIREELKNPNLSVKNFDKEIHKAIETIPVVAGVYHLNFLEKIKETIILIKKRTEDASTWLEVFNQRTAKRRNYWSKVQKLGTQFSQSGERYPAISVG